MHTYPPKFLHLLHQLEQHMLDPEAAVPAHIAQAVTDSRLEYNQFLRGMPIFNLLNLPFVAQRHVLQFMPPMDVFLLTLFYPKYRTVAKSIRWCESPALYLGEIRKRPTLYLRASDKNIPIIQFEVLESFPLPKNKTTIERLIDGRMLTTSIDAGEQPLDPPTITCEANDVDFLWTSLLKNFNETFRLTQQIDLYVTPFTLEILPNNANLRKLTIEMGELEWRYQQMLESDCRYFERYIDRLYDNKKLPKLIHIMVEVNTRFEQRSKMFSVDTLLLRRGLTGAHLLNFTGKQLILELSNLKTQDIIDFLDSWMRVKNVFGLSQIELIIIRFGKFNVDEIYRKIQSQPWNPTKRDAIYKPMNKLELPVSENEFDCTNARDIVRGCDNMLASFKVTPYKFNFFVWKNRFP